MGMVSKGERWIYAAGTQDECMNVLDKGKQVLRTDAYTPFRVLLCDFIHKKSGSIKIQSLRKELS